MLFCRSCFQSWFHSERLGLFNFFVFVLSNKYYLSKSIYQDFRCQKISFLCKHNFCIDEKNAQWHWDTKIKMFHESISWSMKCPWNCISWNALKEKFHSASFPLEKGVLKISSKFTGEHPCRSVISIKLSHFGMGVFLWICCIFSKNLLLRTPLDSCFGLFKALKSGNLFHMQG